MRVIQPGRFRADTEGMVQKAPQPGTAPGDAPETIVSERFTSVRPESASDPAWKRDPSRGRLFGSRRILGMRVDGADYERAVETIVDMAEAGRGGATCVASRCA